MNILPFIFCGVPLSALPTGALFWQTHRILVVSDLHLGKSERIARRSGQMLPPYETTDTLGRLEDAINATDPTTVICLGDSFDDLEAGRTLSETHVAWVTRLMAGRRWIWIEGNHDPGPLEFGGTHLASFTQDQIVFRHIASESSEPEISGHYHPKAEIPLRGRLLSRPCFLFDERKLILPAFGTYTGGLRSSSPELSGLMSVQAKAILTGPSPCVVPMPR
ncbi:ligase-associated DNA damage response endonuclease PdeM [Litoreibacter roseus]|uniref:Metallophosphoesterase n=1 Tax=Litoreibacter roseus TaxID=2601869 RepID=A0A6N6JGP0_9RHOB|nr:ligase-associated DNA damage response endonuclease PdeM [Litoreibacter roseus]GFE65396.1 metallophosphoesterase [Litoreibacter roseus]